MSRLGIKPQPGLCNHQGPNGVLCVSYAGHKGDHRSVLVSGLERVWPTVRAGSEPEPITHWHGLPVPPEVPHA